MTEKEKLALKVNEIFHDLEGRKYQQKHTDIFKGETVRWQKAAKKYYKEYNSPVNILDIGTGTGFIPVTTAEFLSEKDQFICSDISGEMLKVSEKNVNAKNFKCKFSYIKLNGNEIDTDGNKLSVITMNSVVHHIPDLNQFFRQLNEIIPPGGRILIGHEPNRLFYQNKVLVNLYIFLRMFSSARTFLLSIARITRMNIVFKKIVKNKQSADGFEIEINKKLIDEGLIDKELTKNEINKMVDYHSPSAGYKIDKSKGIDIEEIRKQKLPDFKTEYFESYNFLSKISNKNSLMKKIDRSLSKKYKGMGATFFVVLKRNLK